MARPRQRAWPPRRSAGCSPHGRPGEAQVLIKSVSDVVAVQHKRLGADVEEALLDLNRDGGLPASRQPSQPDHHAPMPVARLAVLFGDRSLVPSDVRRLLHLMTSCRNVLPR